MIPAIGNITLSRTISAAVITPRIEPREPNAPFDRVKEIAADCFRRSVLDIDLAEGDPPLHFVEPTSRLVDFLVDLRYTALRFDQFLDGALASLEDLHQSVAQGGTGLDPGLGIDELLGQFIRRDVGRQLFGFGIVGLVLQQGSHRSRMASRDCQLQYPAPVAVLNFARQVHPEDLAAGGPLLFADIRMAAHQAGISCAGRRYSKPYYRRVWVGLP